MVVGGFYIMDTFIEQIVAIKKTAKTWTAYILIALFAIILMTAAFMFLGSAFIIIDALILYGAYKLYTMLSIEYEYIVTNSTVDIDKIISKSSRKRVVSFDLTSVLSIEKYNGKIPQDLSKECFFVCNANDENAYLLVYKTDGKPKKSFVFAPNERTITAMKNFLPRHLCENL